jgi:molybdopterin synthase catalytic subunit
LKAVSLIPKDFYLSQRSRARAWRSGPWLDAALRIVYFGLTAMFEVTRRSIDPRALELAVSSEARGGLVTFLGVVRERAGDGRAVTGLSYEAYDEMAVAEFEGIAAEARERFGDVGLAIVHRVGDLQVGEIAVAVVASSPHRGAAFDACEYAIDELKRRAPIWKREHYVDGNVAWIHNE